MTEKRLLTAIGLMSGTSMDGIDAAVITTDGERVADFGPVATTPYEAAFRDRLRAVLGRDDKGAEIDAVEDELTRRHAAAVKALVPSDSAIDLIGFHGQTILHRPEQRLTRQIGDGARLAAETGIAVVNDFRTADVLAGGEGAPFVPLFHAALAKDFEKPLAVLNIGGVANVTWLGAKDEILAFDTGPGNALIDDWLIAATGRPFDAGGALARAGRVDRGALKQLLDHPYFQRPAPKSLDRNAFDRAPVAGLSPADGAATLTRFTAEAIARSRELLPVAPQRWLVTGGGRHNAVLMVMLGEVLAVPVEAVEQVGWNGDALEAQAFAFLAVRSRYGLPLSLPSTTGVDRPMPGGVLHLPPEASRPKRA